MRIRLVSTRALAVAGIVTATALSGAVFGSGSVGASTVDTDLSTPGTTTFTVPDGVTQITVDVSGAQGGDGGWNTAGGQSLVPVGGLGGQAKTVLAVTPGETLTIVVGARGGNGGCNNAALTAGGTGGTGAGNGGSGGAATAWNGPQGCWPSGGGGGGGSAILRGSEVLVVAGGGGGGGGRGNNANPDNPIGGVGGGTTGGDGGLTDHGTGGTASAPGVGGTGQGGAAKGGDGVGADGGTGGTRTDVDVGVGPGGGGGGGGLFGGGGGGTFQGSLPGGGGGGSGLCGGGCIAFTAGVRAGDGRVLITFDQAVVVQPSFTG